MILFNLQGKTQTRVMDAATSSAADLGPREASFTSAVPDMLPRDARKLHCKQPKYDGRADSDKTQIKQQLSFTQADENDPAQVVVVRIPTSSISIYFPPKTVTDPK